MAHAGRLTTPVLGNRTYALGDVCKSVALPPFSHAPLKRTGATLAVHALEELGIEHTVGIPGVHNTELYDALGASDPIEPPLVTHEGGGAFMADGVSRTSDQTSTLVPPARPTR